MSRSRSFGSTVLLRQSDRDAGGGALVCTTRSYQCSSAGVSFDNRTETPAEEHWYERVVHKASNHMRAPLRSKPEKYYRHALEARMDLTQAIVGMKDYYDIPEEQ